MTETGLSPFYRLRTKLGGDGIALDVTNDTGTSSIRLCMTGTGSYSGQYWRFDPWSSGSGYRLSSDFTDLGMHLGVYSDTLEPHLASGDFTGQH